MSIIASCGHQLTDEEGLGKTINIKDNEGIISTTVCNKCFKLYESKKMIVVTHPVTNSKNPKLYTQEEVIALIKECDFSGLPLKVWVKDKFNLDI